MRKKVIFAKSLNLNGYLANDIWLYIYICGTINEFKWLLDYEMKKDWREQKYEKEVIYCNCNAVPVSGRMQ